MINNTYFILKWIDKEIDRITGDTTENENYRTGRKTTLEQVKSKIQQFTRGGNALDKQQYAMLGETENLIRDAIKRLDHADIMSAIDHLREAQEILDDLDEMLCNNNQVLGV